MPAETFNLVGKRFVDRFLFSGFTLLVLALILVIMAASVPIKFDLDSGRNDQPNRIESLRVLQPHIQPLLVKIAERQLIQPAQLKAAVKNTGAADRLLNKLKLQGVVQMGADSWAYVWIEKQGTKKFWEGDKLIGFTVKKIEPGKITLSLEGVDVILGH